MLDVDAALLLLADGRFPAGGHAHSSGLEAAVAAGRVNDLAQLRAFLTGRLATQGLVAAAFAAATHQAATAHQASAAPQPAATYQPAMSPSGLTEQRATARQRSGAPEQSSWPGVLAVLDAELDARTPSPALRLASRRQGRAQLRAARAIWPTATLALATHHPDGPHHPIALGLTTVAAGRSADDAALLAAYTSLTGPASAAVRLLGLDPYAVQTVLVALAPQCSSVAREAAAAAGKPPAELPSASAPLADISAELHATWEVRLFAS